MADLRPYASQIGHALRGLYSWAWLGGGTPSTSYAATWWYFQSTGQPAPSYRTLLSELATQTRNTTRLHGQSSTFEKLTQPTTLQAEALNLAAHAPVVTVR